MDYSDHDRFVEKIELTETGCWRWTACIRKQDGYGSFGLDGRIVSAHQAAWILFIGDLPVERELDHFECHHRWCANPNHLRVATDKQQCENRKEKQVCRHGHRYDEVGFDIRVTKDKNGNPYEYRTCKACLDAYKTIANQRRRVGFKTANPLNGSWKPT